MKSIAWFLFGFYAGILFLIFDFILKHLIKGGLL